MNLSLTTYVRTPGSYLTSLPPTDNNAHVAPGLHNSHAHPLLEETRSFRRLRVCLDRVLHQKKREQSFQLLLSEIPSRKQNKKWSVTPECPGALERIPLPPLTDRNSAPERHSVVRHRFSVLRELLRRHVSCRDVLVRSLVDRRVQMDNPRCTHDLVSRAECVPAQFGRLRDDPNRHGGTGTAEGLLDRRVQQWKVGLVDEVDDVLLGVQREGGIRGVPTGDGLVDLCGQWFETPRPLEVENYDPVCYKWRVRLNCPEETDEKSGNFPSFLPDSL